MWPKMRTDLMYRSKITQTSDTGFQSLHPFSFCGSGRWLVWFVGAIHGPVWTQPQKQRQNDICIHTETDLAVGSSSNGPGRRQGFFKKPRRLDFSPLPRPCQPAPATAPGPAAPRPRGQPALRPTAAACRPWSRPPWGRATAARPARPLARRAALPRRLPRRPGSAPAPTAPAGRRLVPPAASRYEAFYTY